MRLVKTLMAVAAVALLAAPVRAQSIPTLTGEWTFTVQSPSGTGTPTVTFVQKGDSLTGKYASLMLGSHDFTGSVKDGKITFWFDASFQGQDFTMTFSGAFDGPDAVKGSIDFSGAATGAFTGKRNKAP